MKSTPLFIAVLLSWPLAALAHAHLRQALPADGSTLASPPVQFMLKFSEPAHLTALSVQKQGDAHPQHIGPLPTAASAQFSVPAPPLTPGAYELRYRVISADSHVVSGSLHFTVARP